eukprot:Lankesteria_metandrocarpae@DN1625_c0_g1_i2.p1
MTEAGTSEAAVSTATNTAVLTKAATGTRTMTTDENTAVVAGTANVPIPVGGSSMQTTTEVLVSMDSEGPDSLLSHHTDDSRRASALNLEGLSADRKSQVLEMRFRTVRYVLKHQSTINDELVAYCNLCHSWMHNVEHALAERGIPLDIPVPAAFRISKTLPATMNLATHTSAVANSSSGTGVLTAQQQQQQQNYYSNNLRNRRAVSTANVMTSGIQRATKSITSLENVAATTAAHNYRGTGARAMSHHSPNTTIVICV